MVGRRWPRTVLVGAMWLGALAVGVVVMAEGLLRVRVAVHEAREARNPSAFARLQRAYSPFAIQHLHPYYLFFFPLDQAARLAIGNEVCSIDADGFREPGPAHAGGRRLAFLLGGSAAFGYYATSNATTITSYLNGLQSDYFFVNAGVPSWNTTQEMFRLAAQIADLHPALVVAYDGANDAVLANLANTRRHTPYPAGTPESFDQLEDLVDDLRAEANLLTFDRLLPQVSHRARKYSGAFREKYGSPVVPPVTGFDVAGVDAAARRYVNNHARMADLSRGSGARFMAVFQPIAGLHRHLAASSDERDEMVEAFHQRVSAHQSSAFEYYDLSSMFDEDIAPVAAAEGQRPEDAIFVDGVHLHDLGNEIVAKRLLRLVLAK
ncbi:MAG: SGNH/GDSL hydrolase family protein [Vicinamibacterales bacterium]